MVKDNTGYLSPCPHCSAAVRGARSPGHTRPTCWEAGGPTGVLEDLADAVASVGGVADVAVATDAVRRAQLWRYREGLTEAINVLGPPHKLDVTLPPRRLADFVAEVPAVVAEGPEMAAFRAIERALDPAGILNLNVLLPPLGHQ